MRTLGIIPARGGSKGIPRKNVVPLAGQPLLSYTIRAAQGSRRLSRTILSTDDCEIVAVARSFGMDVPFIRPADLASDTATSMAVARHALQYAETEGEGQYDAVCLLQPTCPLRNSNDIDAALEILEQSDADAVVSLSRVEEPHPFKMMQISDGVLRPLFPDHWRETLRRQELPPVFYLNGALYCVRRSILVDHGSLWGTKTLAYTMPAERSVNIDRSTDLAVAEALLTLDSRPSSTSRPSASGPARA